MVKGMEELTRSNSPGPTVKRCENLENSLRVSSKLEYPSPLYPRNGRRTFLLNSHNMEATQMFTNGRRDLLIAEFSN